MFILTTYIEHQPVWIMLVMLSLFVSLNSCLSVQQQRWTGDGKLLSVVYERDHVRTNTIDTASATIMFFLILGVGCAPMSALWCHHSQPVLGGYQCDLSGFDVSFDDTRGLV
jgi:hypothetical protein